MPTAIVTGATGITGLAIVEHLLRDSTYNKIYTLSRSQSGHTHDKIQHATLDLQSSAQQMSKDLAEISGDVVFFCAYLACDDEAEAAKVNGAMLQNFIEALTISGAIKQIKRIILTCGLKQYGVHLGVAKQPMEETDPPLEGSGWPPNFYYDQQKVLIDNAKKASWDWVVTFPQDVLGFAKANFMNECTALGLYCAISKVLNPNSELPFPGSKANYLSFNCWTSANLHAQFCLWAAATPQAGNNIFNVTNGDTESWQNLWPKLAARYGCTVPKDMFPGGDRGAYGDHSSKQIQLASKPPASIQALGMGLSTHSSFNSPSMVHQQIDTVVWAKRPDVQKAWAYLRDTYKLDQSTWDKATWGFLTFVLGREFSCVVSMSKARKLGWTGYQDTWDAFEEVFDRCEKEGLIPPAAKLRSDKSTNLG